MANSFGFIDCGCEEGGGISEYVPSFQNYRKSESNSDGEQVSEYILHVQSNLSLRQNTQNIVCTLYQPTKTVQTLISQKKTAYDPCSLQIFLQKDTSNLRETLAKFDSLVNLEVKLIVKFFQFLNICSNIPKTYHKHCISFHKKIINSNLTNVSMLQQCVTLQTLILNGNSLKSLDDLGSKPNLVTLSICENQIKDFNFYHHTPLLQTLNCSNNLIENLSQIANFRFLRTLRVASNNIQTITK